MKNTLHKIEKDLKTSDRKPEEEFFESYSHSFPIMVSASVKETHGYYCYVLNLPLALSHGDTKEKAVEEMRSSLHNLVQYSLNKEEELPWIAWHTTANLEYLSVLGGKSNKDDEHWIRFDEKARRREKSETRNAEQEKTLETSVKVVRKRKTYSESLPNRVFEQLHKSLSKKTSLFTPKGNKLFWYLKQLFPLTYRSHYSDAIGERRFAVWKMWFGKVYQYEDVIIND